MERETFPSTLFQSHCDLSEELTEAKRTGVVNRPGMFCNRFPRYVTMRKIYQTYPCTVQLHNTFIYVPTAKISSKKWIFPATTNDSETEINKHDVPLWSFNCLLKAVHVCDETKNTGYFLSFHKENIHFETLIIRKTYCTNFLTHENSHALITLLFSFNPYWCGGNCQDSFKVPFVHSRCFFFLSRHREYKNFSHPT